MNLQELFWAAVMAVVITAVLSPAIILFGEFMDRLGEKIAEDSEKEHNTDDEVGE